MNLLCNVHATSSTNRFVLIYCAKKLFHSALIMSKSQFHAETKIMQNVKGNQAVDVPTDWREIYGRFKRGEPVELLQWTVTHLPHEFSSDPSAQSFSPLQKSPRSTQLPSPQAKKPSWQRGSSVTSRGFTLRSLFLSLQFLTASFQSQVCFSMSKKRPAGHRMACRPYSNDCYRNFVIAECCPLTEEVHWMTSRHESPSLATNRNHSAASLSLHSSFSKDSSVFFSDLSSCRLTRIAFAVEWKSEEKW